jgi:UDP-N-acetylglucosamine 2-epimerase
VKILTVAGSRAQAIGLSRLSNRIREAHEEVFVFCPPIDDLPAEWLWQGGLGLPRPRYQWVLRADTAGRRAFELTIRLERAVRRERPDVVLVCGGSEASMAGALVAAQLHFASAHLEAGLRAPRVCAADDVNRRVADRLATFRFCATPAGAAQLEREGIREGVYVVGDPALDALAALRAQADDHEEVLKEVGLQSRGYYLAVVSLPERRQGIGKLTAWLAALEGLDLPVALLLHPRAALVMHESSISPPGEVRLLEPLDPPGMLALEAEAKALVTDSPAVQREAIFLGVPCVAVGEPAWPEAGLSGAEPAGIAAALRSAQDVPARAGQGDPEGHRGAALRAAHNADDQPFGDGRASERIVEILSGGISPAAPQET